MNPLKRAVVDLWDGKPATRRNPWPLCQTCRRRVPPPLCPICTQCDPCCSKCGMCGNCIQGCPGHKEDK